MGWASDLGTGIVAVEHEASGFPMDEYGHLLDPYDPGDGVIVDGWLSVGTELFNLTSPYGHLYFAIGNGDDFWCFDYRIITGMFDSRRFVVLHATINSETGGFIERGGYDIIPLRNFSGQAMEYVESALEWCSFNDIRHSKRGWNQDPYFFYRAVETAVREARGIAVPNFSDRERRMGGKGINRCLGLDERWLPL